MSNKQFGEIPFITFYSTVLSRLAYFTSQSFLPAYDKIFGDIIPVSLMKDINNSQFDKIFDSSIYQNTITSGKVPTYQSNGKSFIDFTNMSEKINNVTDIFYKSSPGEIKPILTGGVNPPLLPTIPPTIPPTTVITGTDFTVAYISISTSNYGGYYILVDSRMPNSIFVVFRGTYSAKSAGSYSKPTSIIPYAVGKDLSPEELKKKLLTDQGKMYGILGGINKILDDVYHTIIQSMLYLAQTYLKPIGKESIKVFTTGHSLGGGLCTLFANDWYETTRISPYDKAPYDIFTKQICCISIASPRVLSPGLSNNFCQKILDKQIFYKRITNRGDPVPALPQKSYTGLTDGFEHPCSAKKYGSTQRNVISIDCGSAMKTIPVPGPAYEKPLDCRNTKTSIFRGNFSGNPLAHTVYMYINFVTAVPVAKFLSSALPARVKSRPTEIQRTSSGATVARIILGISNHNSNSNNIEFKTSFFVLNQLRPKDKQTFVTNPHAKPISSEDTLMNPTVFLQLIKGLKPLTGDLNPVIPTQIDELNIGSIEPMPFIDGIMKPTNKLGGKKSTRNKKSHRTNKKAKKTRKSSRTYKKMRKSRKSRKSRKL